MKASEKMLRAKAPRTCANREANPGGFDGNPEASHAVFDAKPGHTGWRRLYYATLFSAAGFKAAWIHEAAFRQECLLAVILVPAAFWLGRDSVETCLLLGSWLLVLIVELLNSAVEAAVDRAGTDHHLLAARAKDLGSAAVFVSLALTFTVWALIGWQSLA